MIKVVDFEPRLAPALPETYRLLLTANLTLHPAVERVVLHGSRGLAGGCRVDSDMDLSLIVDPSAWSTHSDPAALFHTVLETTLTNWSASIELDLAVVFDVRRCSLKCFDMDSWDDSFCTQGGMDCFGLYKTQKGFNGLVTNAGVQVKRMIPCLKIWQRP